MVNNSTCRICGQFQAPDVTDLGQCFPYRTKRTCEAPVIPTPECDEEGPVTSYDPDTESFVVTTIMYDNTCSALQDSEGSPLLSLIA